MLYLSLKLYHVMQTTNDIFVNSLAIKTKIAGKLIDDTVQVSGKKTNSWVSNASKTLHN